MGEIPRLDNLINLALQFYTTRDFNKFKNSSDSFLPQSCPVTIPGGEKLSLSSKAGKQLLAIAATSYARSHIYGAVTYYGRE
jgi:hypothetical protein